MRLELCDVRSMTLPEWEALIASLGEPAYRAKQVFTWIHQKGAESFDAMSDLPRRLREVLPAHGRFSAFLQAEKWLSDADAAIKYLFALEKNTIIESVLMQHEHGSTLCVSTQAGCRMGCRFCASTVGGLERNLTAGEMCAQVYTAQRDSGERVDGVVLMGCGEPLDNFDASLRFISLISHPSGLNIGQRHITLSTCGLVPQILALAEKRLQITLAVSLHAPCDDIRRTLMPVANRYTIQETLDACAAYASATHRRITFEYALIDGVNDGDTHAQTLGDLLQGLLCHVNLIPVNETSPRFSPSRRTDRFLGILTRRGIPVTVRRSLGGDIQAACGQLRRRYMEFNP